MKTWAAANGRRGELGLRPAASFAEGPEEGDFAAAGVGEEQAVARAFLEEEERRKRRERRMTRGTH